jgi:hypothetical protein
MTGLPLRGHIRDAYSRGGVAGLLNERWEPSQGDFYQGLCEEGIYWKRPTIMLSFLFGSYPPPSVITVGGCSNLSRGGFFCCLQGKRFLFFCREGAVFVTIAELVKDAWRTQAIDVKKKSRSEET